MKISEKGKDLIKSFEGYREKAYKCPAGLWTIGYGHVIKATDSFAKIKTFVTSSFRHRANDTDVLGALRPLSMAEINALFDKDSEDFASKVDVLITNKSTSQNEFDAMVSLAYNIGISAFKSSSVLKFHNMGKNHEAGEWFLAWKYATVGGVKKPILLNRRNVERAVYQSGNYERLNYVK